MFSMFIFSFFICFVCFQGDTEGGFADVEEHWKPTSWVHHPHHEEMGQRQQSGSLNTLHELFLFILICFVWYPYACLSINNICEEYNSSDASWKISCSYKATISTATLKYLLNVYCIISFLIFAVVRKRKLYLQCIHVSECFLWGGQCNK